MNEWRKEILKRERKKESENEREGERKKEREKERQAECGNGRYEWAWTRKKKWRKKQDGN